MGGWLVPILNLFGLGGGAAATVPITDSLVSYWPLDEVSGTRFDAAGSNDLTDNNDTGSATGKISLAASFNALEYLSRPDNASLSTGDIDFTVVGWVRLNTVSSFQSLVSRWNGFAGHKEYNVVYDNAEAKFGFFVSSDGTAQDGVYADIPTPVIADTWYHIVAWHDAAGNEIGITVNNGDEYTASYSDGVFDSDSAFWIGGKEDDFSGSAEGLIDEVGFWKRVLTPAERATLYGGGAGIAYPFTGTPAEPLGNDPRGAPTVPRAPAADKRLRPHADKVATILNDLLRKGYIRKSGLNEYQIIGGGFAAPRAPTSTDDASAGVVVGATFVNTVTGAVYINTFNWPGMATWFGPLAAQS